MLPEFELIVIYALFDGSIVVELVTIKYIFFNFYGIFSNKMILKY